MLLYVKICVSVIMHCRVKQLSLHCYMNGLLRYIIPIICIFALFGGEDAAEASVRQCDVALSDRGVTETVEATTIEYADYATPFLRTSSSRVNNGVRRGVTRQKYLTILCWLYNSYGIHYQYHNHYHPQCSHVLFPEPALRLISLGRLII